MKSANSSKGERDAQNLNHPYFENLTALLIFRLETEGSKNTNDAGYSSMSMWGYAECQPAIRFLIMK